VINKRKVAKHFLLDIGEASFTWRRGHGNIDAEAAFRRDLRHPRPRPHRQPGRPSGRGRLQGPRPRRAGFPAKTTWSCAPPTTASTAASNPRADLHGRLLSVLAPAPGLGTAHQHRPKPAPAGQPRRPGPAFTRRRPKASPKVAATARRAEVLLVRSRQGAVRVLRMWALKVTRSMMAGANIRDDTLHPPTAGSARRWGQDS